MKVSVQTGEFIYQQIKASVQVVSEFADALHTMEDAGLKDSAAYGVVKRSLAAARQEQKNLMDARYTMEAF